MKKLMISMFVGVMLVGLFLVGMYWTTTQPILVVSSKKVDDSILQIVPTRNQEIITFIESNGKKIAPTYDSVVCTEFVIKVLDAFKPLSRKEKKSVRIITRDRLDSLVRVESSIIKGVQTALLSGNKGIEISTADVKPGDFVQFWNTYQGEAYGHCGVVMEIVPNESLTVYSSHPLTNGFGKQKFLWPDKAYFVRLH